MMRITSNHQRLLKRILQIVMVGILLFVFIEGVVMRLTI